MGFAVSGLEGPQWLPPSRSLTAYVDYWRSWRGGWKCGYRQTFCFQSAALLRLVKPKDVYVVTRGRLFPDHHHPSAFSSQLSPLNYQLPPPSTHLHSQWPCSVVLNDTPSGWWAPSLSASHCCQSKTSDQSQESFHSSLEPPIRVIVGRLLVAKAGDTSV